MLTAGPRSIPGYRISWESCGNRKTDSQWVGFRLKDRTGALQNCMSLIPKGKEDPGRGLEICCNLFIFNSMAERVGFESGL